MLSTLDGQVSKASANLLRDRLSSDPSLLFVTELRYQIVARKVAAKG
jgi:hypothetical protein